MITKLYFALRALEFEALGYNFNEVYDAYLWHFTGLGKRQSINAQFI